MSRTTIDYGIDLGTTNSSVAVLQGTSPDVIPDDLGSLVVPSAVWYDKRGHLYVGPNARQQYFYDPENGDIEFKLRMGQRLPRTFARSATQMLPEQLSAEVLKALKENVRTQRQEDLRAAVITVPAAFGNPECEATKCAAGLAGIETSPLLQEPVAAALAYGFQSLDTKAYWLVYDFGGGTFDAAIMQVNEGIIQVVNHAGDNGLGGKRIDWDIVYKLIVPHVAEEYSLGDDFRWENKRWKRACAKLKLAAEEAKIRVSRRNEPAEVWIEDLCNDVDGETVEVQITLTPQALRSITEPYENQALNLCKKALREKSLAGKDMEKIILVGGSSLFPWLSQRLASELGTRVDLSIDPITVVARGAAVFAGTQRLEAEPVGLSVGTYRVQLKYEPVGAEVNPTVFGKIMPPQGQRLRGFTLEVADSQGRWRSGKIELPADGGFETQIHAEKGRKCEYRLELRDARGRPVPCSPDIFSYTVGVPITSVPLQSSISIDLADDRSHCFFRKGDPLPARATNQDCKTVCHLRRGLPRSEQNVIRFSILEGQHEKASRNRRICVFEIHPDDPRLKRDVPAGTTVEVTLDIDASRTIKASVFIPLLDEVFEVKWDWGYVAPGPQDLKNELGGQMERLARLEELAQKTRNPDAGELLASLSSEEAVEIAARDVQNAQRDSEAAVEADRRVRELAARLDEIEKLLSWPQLVDDSKQRMEETRKLVEAHGTDDEKASFKGIVSEIETAIQHHRDPQVRSNLDELQRLYWQILLRQPWFWFGLFERLKESRATMQDKAAAERLFAQGDRAMREQDLEALSAACRQLWRMLPREESAALRSPDGGTLILDQ